MHVSIGVRINGVDFKKSDKRHARHVDTTANFSFPLLYIYLSFIQPHRAITLPTRFFQLPTEKIHPLSIKSAAPLQSGPSGETPAEMSGTQPRAPPRTRRRPRPPPRGRARGRS